MNNKGKRMRGREEIKKMTKGREERAGGCLGTTGGREKAGKREEEEEKGKRKEENIQNIVKAKERGKIDAIEIQPVRIRKEKDRKGER